MKAIVYFWLSRIFWIMLFCSSTSIFFDVLIGARIPVGSFSVRLFSLSIVFILTSSFEPVRSLVLEGKEKVKMFRLGLKRSTNTIDEFFEKLPILVANMVNGSQDSLAVKEVRFGFCQRKYELTIRLNRDGLIDPLLTLALIEGGYSKSNMEALGVAIEEILKNSFPMVWKKFNPQVFLIKPDRELGTYVAD